MDFGSALRLARGWRKDLRVIRDNCESGRTLELGVPKLRCERCAVAKLVLTGASACGS